MAARKAGLSSLIVGFFADIELDFPSERDKWMVFLNDLQPENTLPNLPKMNSPKEKMFFTSRNVITEYYNIVGLESRVSKYNYIADFNGTVTQIFAEPGSIINPGAQIAKIVKTGEYEVKVPVDMKDIELYQNESTANFIDPENKKIGTGKILRISDFINQQTQSADVYYSITPNEGVKIYNGMFVNVTIDQEVAKNSMIIPRTAIKDGRVNILKDNKVEPVKVLSLGSIPDSVYGFWIEERSKSHSRAS